MKMKVKATKANSNTFIKMNFYIISFSISQCMIDLFMISLNSLVKCGYFWSSVLIYCVLFYWLSMIESTKNAGQLIFYLIRGRIGFLDLYFFISFKKSNYSLNISVPSTSYSAFLSFEFNKNMYVPQTLLFPLSRSDVSTQFVDGFVCELLRKV